MDTPDIGPDQGHEDLPTIDLTDPVIPFQRATFHVNDRVERLTGLSEQSHWGTITGQIVDSDRYDWLVLDNLGVTHRDSASDLYPATRGKWRRAATFASRLLTPGETD